MQETVADIFERIASIANSTQRKVFYLVIAGTLSTLYLAWVLYSAESPIWWNAIKCGLVVIPTLIWLFIWMVLNQLTETPELVANLAAKENGLASELQKLNISKPSGLRDVFRTVQTIRHHEGLDVVFETISGVGFVANPFFVMLVFITLPVLLILILLALMVLLF